MVDGPVEGDQRTGSRVQVLVVDDNRDSADSLCMLLQFWGFECRVAYDGAAGLEEVRACPPDCLILDIAMPRMDGYTVAQLARRLPEMEKAKIIALTAFSDERHVRRVREAGFDFHLVKPADPTELERILTMLNEVVKLASRTEELARQNVELATETRELLQEVKEDIREIKDEVKEIKEELREVREGNGEEGGDPG
jgi:DNA-binding response OmpR family regulator